MNLFRKIFVLFLITQSSFSQELHEISGYVIDFETGTPLVGANVIDSDSGMGVTSNYNGYYSINVNQGSVVLICSFIGYTMDTLFLEIQTDLNRDFELKTNAYNLSEVTLKDDRLNVESTRTSVISISKEEIKNVPQLLGEMDLIKAIQLLPGIQSGNEGTSGFYVRGGGPDQNLILFDGAPVYNTSHLLGFFSTFNEQAVSSIEIIKGGFPAEYGGRLSSILDITGKAGNMKEWKVNGGLGIISGSLCLEGPIKKDTTSVLLAVRRTWIDQVSKPLLSLVQNSFDFGGIEAAGNYYFYDLNFKLVHKVSQKDQINFSFYSGSDNFSGMVTEEEEGVDDDYNWYYNEGTNYGLLWGNIISSLKWRHLFNDQLFLNTTLFYSQYAFENKILSNSDWIEEYPSETFYYPSLYDYSYQSAIEDLGIKFDFIYDFKPKHQLNFGGSYIKHHFSPSSIDLITDYEGGYTDTTMTFSDAKSPDEAFVYLEDQYAITDRLTSSLGLHYSMYHESSKLYNSLQPRVSFRYLLNENSSLKLSYATMQQNIHLLTNSSYGLPNDIWVPATRDVPPQYSQQFVAGYNKSFDENAFEGSVEFYYKKMDDLITYAEGSNILGTNFSSWEDRVEMNGLGRSYGLELFLKKNNGKLTGWIGYTLSRSIRQFETINLGLEYPYKFDRPHDLSLVSVYKLNEGTTFSLTWVYGSGNTITIPKEQYLLFSNGDAQQYYEYGEKNSYRMQAYHRLDFGVNFVKQKSWGERIWTVSIYNVYNRHNPFFIYFEDVIDDNVEYIEAKQISLFPIIPTVRYGFKF
ncbi:MAG: TonB-dependent receptor [Flavobacteriales bacterium]|nr:TonB-dependent receptor [Flavobacteriales bacterium]